MADDPGDASSCTNVLERTKAIQEIERETAETGPLDTTGTLPRLL